LCCQKHTNMLYSIWREKEEENETLPLGYEVQVVQFSGGIKS